MSGVREPGEGKQREKEAEYQDAASPSTPFLRYNAIAIDQPTLVTSSSPYFPRLPTPSVIHMSKRLPMAATGYGYGKVGEATARSMPWSSSLHGCGGVGKSPHEGSIVGVDGLDAGRSVALHLDRLLLRQPVDLDARGRGVALRVEFRDEMLVSS